MLWNVYIKMFALSLIPIGVAVVLCLLEKNGHLNRIKYVYRQILIGVLFGATVFIERAVPSYEADGFLSCGVIAPLCAGLFFDSPAALVSGFLGACAHLMLNAPPSQTNAPVIGAVTLMLAGCYAALLRRFLFNKKRPKWLIALCSGIVMEILHMSILFFSNLYNIDYTLDVIQMSFPMGFINGIAVMLTSILLSILSKGGTSKLRKSRRLTDIIQSSLLICVLFVFSVTVILNYESETKVAITRVKSLLATNSVNLLLEIQKELENDMILIAGYIARSAKTLSLQEIMDEYNILGISKVDTSGIVTDSSDPEQIGYDIRSDSQGEQLFEMLQEGPEGIIIDDLYISQAEANNAYVGIQTENGYIVVGYDGNYIQSFIPEVLYDITANRTVGEDGFSLIADNDGYFFGEGEICRATHIIEFGLNSDTDYDDMVECEYDGEKYYCMAIECSVCTIFSFCSDTEVMRYRDIAVSVNILVQVLVYAVLFTLVYLLIDRHVLRGLRTFANGLNGICDGDLDVVLNVRDNTEFSRLSDDINLTVSKLKEHIEREKTRIDRELILAKNIQSSALPNIFPAFPNRREFSIFAQMRPAKDVGGDFYDLYLTGENTLNFIAADVSGKGIPAAMFMMRAKTELKRLVENSMAVNDAFATANEHLCEGNEADMFVTAWMGQLNLKTGDVTYANAGHNPPLIRRKNGKYTYLREKAGFILAGMEGMRYKSNHLQLAPGEMIFLYTDGVTEATNAEKELYGEDRLLACLNGAGTTNVEELCRIVQKDVDAFVGDAPQFDDITMLTVCYNGTPKYPELHFENAAFEDIPEIQDFVETELSRLKCPMQMIYKMSIAIDEIYSNIVKYAYFNNPGPATVRLSLDNNRICLLFIDKGVPYNPLMKEDPDVTLSAEEREVGGLGIFMVKRSMDEIIYAYKNDCNMLYLYKDIPLDSQGDGKQKEW